MVVSMDTANTNDYLYAKQLLCILSLTRVQRAVKVGKVEFDHDAVQAELKKVLENIKDNLTFPLNAMRTGFSHINFEILHESVCELLKVSPSPVVDKILRGQVQEVHIYGRPDKRDLFNVLKTEFIERNKRFDCRWHITAILKSLDDIFNTVNAYISYSDVKINVGLAIAGINMIEGVDFAFSLAEDGEGVFDCDKDFIIEVKEND